jgi:predicted TPR repeat methyltransferase
MVFGNYARFYDNLYSDKDYAAECRYLEKLFRRHSGRGVRSILDLGCGTGNHDLPLAALSDRYRDR